LNAAYARAIVLDPEILLVEHALEGQCLINVQTFLKCVKMQSAIEGKSIVFVTYEPGLFIDFSNRFIMLYHGNIVFSGTRDDFIKSENRYLSQYMKSSAEGPMRIL
jgi:ABC-type transporter Mla maintaining outer membrane lipid asymmetry ATPase subunit MlaF